MALRDAAAPNSNCPTKPQHPIPTAHWASPGAAAWHQWVDAYILEVMPPAVTPREPKFTKMGEAHPRQ